MFSSQNILGSVKSSGTNLNELLCMFSSQNIADSVKSSGTNFNELLCMFSSQNILDSEKVAEQIWTNYWQLVA